MREREGEKYQCVVASRMPPTGDLACNPGMCPGWEENWWPFGSQCSIHWATPARAKTVINMESILIKTNLFFQSILNSRDKRVGNSMNFIFTMMMLSMSFLHINIYIFSEVLRKSVVIVHWILQFWKFPVTRTFEPQIL